MKHLLIIAFLALALTSCSSKKSIGDAETLPKDIVQKPDNNVTKEHEQFQMKELIAEIDSLVGTEPCTDAANWKFTAIGAKPCGGPSSYIAYPTKLEENIVPKVAQFTAMQSAFNTKYGLMSDCMMVMPPTGIKCEKGKATLIREN